MKIYFDVRAMILALQTDLAQEIEKVWASIDCMWVPLQDKNELLFWAMQIDQIMQLASLDLAST